MHRTSIIIAGRCEQYFQATIDDVLNHAEGDIEIIPVIDGYEPNPPLKITDNRVKPIFLKKSIGQRAAYNLGIKQSTGEYVMKLDAHASVCQGFDRILKEHCPPKTTVLPEMRRLDVKKWEDKKRGKTHFMYFGLDVFCHYWKDYRKRDVAKIKYPEVLTGQGSCWFTTREWNDYIGLLDESLGSWGKVGIEVSLKTWLCGGQQIVNKGAWQAHWFRVGEGRFPYPLSGRQVGRARDFTWNNFFFKETGAFKNQERPFRWLMEKFAPVPGWEAYMADEYKSNRVILYYTDSKLEETLARAVRKNLKTAAGPIPIISVSQKPLDFGKNICVGDKPKTAQSMYEQILAGAEATAKNSIIYLCEHDVFYHPSHFAKLPRDKRAFYFNQNRYYWWVGDTSFYKIGQGTKAFSQAVVYREYLIDHVKARLVDWIPRLKVRRFSWESARPNVDVRHGDNLTMDGPRKKRMRKDDSKKVYNIGGWGGVKHFKSKVSYKGTLRTDIIKYLIALYKYQSYLEIGVDKNQNFKRIECKIKDGVDPNGKAQYTMTSDEFFGKCIRQYDLIFIDGLHLAYQVDRDISNSLNHLNPGGVIVIHDCNPITEEQQQVPHNGQKIWCGDTWKAYMEYRQRNDLEMYVVDTNNGVGIVRPGKQDLIQDLINLNGNLTYQMLERNRENWLNLKSVTWFREYEKTMTRIGMK